MRGHLWFIRRFGLMAWLHYEHARRRGATIEYSAIFTPNEIAVLQEFGFPMHKRIRKVELRVPEDDRPPE